MSFWTFLFVPTILFMVMVAPLWILMHYRAKGKENTSLNAQEQESLDNLLENLDGLTQRIDALEAILNEDQPGWKAASSQKEQSNETTS